MPHARSKEPLPVITVHPEDEPLVCLQINEHWIPYIIGALWPMKFPEYWAGTLDENRNARRDAVNLIAIFEQALEDCGMSNGCCDGSDILITVLTRVTIDGKIQISIDNGATWHDNPKAPYVTTPQLPPYIATNPGTNKCDVASNVWEQMHVTAENFKTYYATLSTLKDILAAMVGALAEAILAILDAPDAALSLIPAIIEWAKNAFTLTPEEYNALFTEEAWNRMLCILYCNTPDDGSYEETDFLNILADCATIPGGDGFQTVGEIFKGMIKFWQVSGLNTIASTGTVHGADCSDCDCECSADNYAVDGARGIELSRTATSITVQAVLLGGQYEAAVRVNEGFSCCHITATATVGTLGSGVWNACADGYHDPYTNGGTALDKLNSILFASLAPLTVQYDFA